MEKAWHGVLWENVESKQAKGLAVFLKPQTPTRWMEYLKWESGPGTLGNPGWSLIEETPVWGGKVGRAGYIRQTLQQHPHEGPEQGRVLAVLLGCMVWELKGGA